MSDVEEIQAVLQGITGAWRQGRLEDLHRFYRPDVVFVQPGFAARLEGREACVQSYRQFLSITTVHAYQEAEPVIDLLGDLAVAMIRFDIDYELQGEGHRDTGHDILVLARDGDGWRVAWRTLFPGGPQPSI